MREARRPAPAGAASWTAGAARPEVLTVSAVNALARDLLESALPPLWIQGEVTGWKRYAGSGHCYFALRDRAAQIRGVMFRTEAQKLPADPEEGMEIRAFGRLTVYEQRGEYQFVAQEIEGLSAGGLWRLAFERLHRKLEAEGLLAGERKRPLPRHPAAIAIVTSPVGAALQDILHVIAARAPWTRVIVSPARVQGDGSPSDIARAIRLVGRSGLADLVIVGRGGGSVEDLWAFNDEVVARAIANCPIPVISAVGHEIDVTIADLVADWRAPTPSAAAERAVPDGGSVAREIGAWRHRMVAGLRRWVDTRRSSERALQASLRAAVRRPVRDRKERMAALAGRLDALSPLSALRRGYAVPLDDGGHVLRCISDFAAGSPFRLRVFDGTVPCRVEDRDPETADRSGNTQ